MFAEFFVQGDLERDCALECAPFMKRTADPLEAQISFIDFVFQPLMDAYAGFLPKAAVLQQQSLDNRRRVVNELAAVKAAGADGPSVEDRFPVIKRARLEWERTKVERK